MEVYFVVYIFNYNIVYLLFLWLRICFLYAPTSGLVPDIGRLINISNNNDFIVISGDHKEPFRTCPSVKLIVVLVKIFIKVGGKYNTIIKVEVS